MRPLTVDKLTGTWATLLLALDDDDRISWPRMEKQLAALVSAGVDGIYTNGSSGEFWSQTEDEFGRLTELAASAGVPFQIGAAHPSPQIALERVRRAAAYAPGAIQVVLPDWFPPNDNEIRSHLRRLADAAGSVPLVLYHPPHAKRVLGADDYAWLLDAVPEIVGIKVGDGDRSWYAGMREVSGRVAMFVPGHHLATGYAHGAAGAYSNVACLHPVAAVRWWRQIVGGDGVAMQTERRLRGFLDGTVAELRTKSGYCNAALDKLLAALGGWSPVGTRMRWPYDGVPGDVVRALRPVAHDVLPDFVPGVS
ncbi:dihydrodipicolinate synthase family protein [Fodinicola acaciae]|uniref:dihydrodipicolinate synthase family protein n=1 Tax=Fodinicola acaciae TaxID=2681555 RepID=UPI0013D3D4F3|nr:dihydrodipicolinate synthase family protein [Fodinicola acaciae]